MKIKCPICECEGHLQLRGRSARVGHYRGYKGKTRIIEWHRVDYDTARLMMVNNGKHGKQKLVNKKPFSDSILKSEWTGRDLNPRPPPCEGGVHAKLNYRPLLGKEVSSKDLELSVRFMVSR